MQLLPYPPGSYSGWLLFSYSASRYLVVVARWLSDLYLIVQDTIMPIPGLQQVNHIAVIAADYACSKHFYCNILGFTVREEHYRAERHSWKGELFLNNHYIIELFSFPQPPARLSYPEACGLRHLAFTVDDIHQAVRFLHDHQICCEPIRTDPVSGKYFTFFADPDGLPLELCQA